MAFTPKEQLVEALKRSRSVAVVLSSAGSADAIGAALALAGLVEAHGKPVEIMCPGFAAERKLAFLPKVESIRPHFRAARKLVLTMPITGELHDLRHEITDGRLEIAITPAEGGIEPGALETRSGEWKHDLIVSVGVPDPNAFAAFGPACRGFFADTPIVNIDTRPENEHYGAINLVDLRAGAVSELVASLIESIDPKLITADIGTCLYAGIVSETRNFHAPNVSPKTLELAGRLVAAGARREEIVTNLFRARPIEALRLWGRVLARLRADREHKIVWSLLGRTDFLHSGADLTHLPDVIDELISRTPDAEVICLLHEHPTDHGKVCGLLSAERGWNALDLAAAWQPTGTNRQARIEAAGVALPELEQRLIGSLRETMGRLRAR
jgi:nanoRNase/pAp phosphatase (c-di-AMP/oligoRNAs hydrolase)